MGVRKHQKKVSRRSEMLEKLNGGSKEVEEQGESMKG